MNLKPYPEYKETCVQWLGNIPYGWDTRKIKYLFEERVEKGFPNEPLLAATQTKGVVPKSHYESRTVTAQKDLHLLKLVKKNDFVISLRSFQGGIELTYFQGIISPAYTIMKPDKDIQVGYFKYFAKSKVFIKLLTTCVTGIREGQNIDYEVLKRNKLPLPPLPEQIQIARYLDWKTSQITKFIKAKKRIIELLMEQIDLLLYSGDTSNKIKNISGWENSFPLNWKLNKAKRIFSEINIKNSSDEPLLAVTQERGVIPKSLCEKNYLSPSENLDGLKLVKNDNFIISLRSFQGGIEYSSYQGIVSPAYNVFELNNNYKKKGFSIYYRYLFKTKPFISLLNTVITGIRDGKNINFSDFAEINLPIPPINNLSKLFHTIKKYESFKKIFLTEKKLLEEYRDRLISDVVTGKIDVRDIKVPELLEEITDDISEEEIEEDEPEGNED
jgi:type I restriction enzyme S subunit